jgi:hypothetical protein
MLASWLGVMLAVSVVAAAVVYSDAMSNLGLRHVLSATPPQFLDVQLVVNDRPTGLADFQRLGSKVERSIEAHVGALNEGTHRLGQVQPLPLRVLSDEEIRGPRSAYIYFQEGFEDHVRLVSGRMPQDVSVQPDGAPRPLEALIGADLSVLMRWREGTVLALVPFADDPTEQIVLNVVGVVEAIDSSHRFWGGGFPRLDIEDFQSEADLAPVFVRQEDFFSGLGERFPSLLGNFWWFVPLDVEAVTLERAFEVEQSLVEMEAEVSRLFPRSALFQGLGRILNRYDEELALARIPVFLFSSLVVGVVFYYLAMVSWMLAHNRGPEAALLRSRGAGRLQISALLGVGDGLVLTIPAVVVGPLLALMAYRLMPIDTPGFANDASGLSLRLLVAVGITGFASLLLFTLSGVSLAGRSIVEFLGEKARPSGKAALYRYAIDVLVLGGIGLIWWQIRGRGGFLSRELGSDDLDIDLTVLLGPALLMLGASLVLLRVLPWVLRLAAFVASFSRWVWLSHGLDRVARDPLPSGAMAVLLMLVTGLGTFGALFGPTLISGQGDQVRYAIGGEVVVSSPVSFQAEPVAKRQRALESVEGVEAVTPIYNEVVRVTTEDAARFNASLTAVDPGAFSQAAWFRKDFADEDLSSLLRPLQVPLETRHGVPLPEGTEAIGLWLSPQGLTGGDILWARFRDSAGLYDSLQLGRVAQNEWTYIEATLLQRAHLTPPLSLVSVYLSAQSLRGPGGWIALDEVTAIVGQERILLEGFESGGGWEVIPTGSGASDDFILSASAAHTGESGALFSWPPGLGGTGSRGMFISPISLPIPALGSEVFSPGQQIKARLDSVVIPFAIKEVVKDLPTSNQGLSAFLLVDAGTLITYVKTLQQSSGLAPEAYWLALGEGADREVVVDALRGLDGSTTQVQDREAQVREEQDNPLAGQAWSGLTTLYLGALTGVAVFGFVLYASLAFRRHRQELGLLRVLGMTGRQLGVLLGLEGLLVALTGVGAGVGVGAWLGSWTLQYLDVTAEGKTVIPSLVLVLDDGRLAAAFGGVMAALAAATVLTLAQMEKMRLAEVLRVEE